jgi:lysophospholipase L1-like esterase
MNMKLKNLLSHKNLDFTAFAPVTAAFLGDSVTHGCFEIYNGLNNKIECYYDHEAVYHAQLKRMLYSIFPNAPLNILNAGISGGSAPQGLERLERIFYPTLLIWLLYVLDSMMYVKGWIKLMNIQLHLELFLIG